MKYPESIKSLIESFQKLPGIGYKSAERYVFHILTKYSDEEIYDFAASLMNLKNKVKRCETCHNITEHKVCEVCEDLNRDQKTIMVVGEVKDVLALERTNQYRGLYHVLDGVIDFSRGIGKDELNVETLLKRLDENPINELILATNATIEGEMTAKYIKNLILDKNINVSRIAYGIPVGGDLQYADLMTIAASLEGRKKF